MSKGENWRAAVFGCLFLFCNIFPAATHRWSRGHYFRPLGQCLTGPSCTHCAETVAFLDQRVCCFHCRLDNLHIADYVCHCLHTRLADPHAGETRGNCSSGRLCDNCAITMTAATSDGPHATRSTTDFCCDDCGIVTPYFHRDDTGCHCSGDAQGRVHKAARRYDPTKDPFSTPQPNASTGTPTSVVLLPFTCFLLLLK